MTQVVDIHDVTNFNNNHLTKKQLESFFAAYKFYLQAHHSQDNDILNMKFSQMVEKAEKYIQDFAAGKLILDPDALDLMEKYIQEFGKNYCRRDGKLVYVFSDDAVKANIRLSQLRFYHQTKSVRVSEAPVKTKVNTSVERKQQSPVQKAVAVQPKNSVAAHQQARTVAPAEDLSIKLPPRNRKMPATQKRAMSVVHKTQPQQKPITISRKQVRPVVKTVTKTVVKPVTQPVVKTVARPVNRTELSVGRTVAQAKQRRNVISLKPSKQHVLKNKWNNFYQQAKSQAQNVYAGTKEKVRRYGVAALAICGLSALTMSNSSSFSSTIDKIVKEAFDKSRKQSLMMPQNQPEKEIYAETPVAPKPSSEKKTEAEHKTYVPKAFYLPQRASLAELAQKHQDSIASTHKKAKIVSPYDASYAQVLQQNRADYKDFAKKVTEQFMYNINRLKNSTYRQKINFYREQGQYFSEIGKTKYITPGKTCESMSNATLLSVACNDSSENYIQEACQDILKEIPNPHACYSSLRTLGTQKTRNLGGDICEIFEKNPNAIVAAWINNPKGGKHRISFVGTGDGQAYMVSYNNDRIIKINKNRLGWLNHLSGEYNNLTTTIINKANEMAIQDLKKEQAAEKSFVDILKQKQSELLSSRI